MSLTVRAMIFDVGMAALQDLLQFADVPADVDLQCRDLVALGIKREDRRLALVEADDIELAGRADDGIGDLGIADEDFRRVSGQIDDHRFADAHRYAPREAGVAAILNLHTGLRESILHRRKQHQRCGQSAHRELGRGVSCVEFLKCLVLSVRIQLNARGPGTGTP